MRISHKIVLPFSLLLAAAFVLITYLSVNTVQRTVFEGVRKQTRDTGRMIFNQGFSLSDGVLRQIGELLGYDMVVRSSSHINLYASRSELMRIERAGIDRLRRKPEYAGYELFRHESPDPGFYLLVLYPKESIRELERAAVSEMLKTAGATLLLALLVGMLIARGISRPIMELVGRVREISGGELDHPLGVGGAAGGEIGDLRKAFERMRINLRDSRDALKRDERLKTLGQLTSAIAHEIRNPVTSMKMTLQIMREKLPEQAGRLDGLLSDLARLEADVSQILDYGRPLKLNPEQVGLDEIVRRAVETVRVKLAHAGIRVVTADAQSVSFTADPERLRQVLVNLVANAVDAMPHGGTVTITGQVEGDRAGFAVTDEGPGIPAERCAEVFEPFVTTKSAGCGLGLAVSKRFVEAMNGTITLVPCAGGASFRVLLPRA